MPALAVCQRMRLWVSVAFFVTQGFRRTPRIADKQVKDKGPLIAGGLGSGPRVKVALASARICKNGEIIR